MEPAGTLMIDTVGEAAYDIVWIADDLDVWLEATTCDMRYQDLP
jgi:hypothetical protein